MAQHLVNGTPGLRASVVTHRQWGKDTTGMHFTCCAAHKRVGNYWHLLPQYNQCRKSIWDSINPDTGLLRIDEAFPKELRAATNETEMKIDFHSGSTYQLVGSDSFHGLVGAMPIGIIFSEWSRANPMAWAYLSPMLEKNGGWAMFLSTPYGRNHMQQIYEYAKNTPGWFAGLYPADKTPVYTPQQLENIKNQYIALFGREEGMAMFLQEYFGSFEGAVLGSYYSRQMSKARADGRITKVPWNPGLEVFTYWDLGLDDSMTLWFIQHVGKSHHVIDYLEDTGMGLEHYAKEMAKKPYKYGGNVMPHDANQREMTNGEIAKSRKDVAESLGIKPIEVVQRAQNMELVINVQIPAVRNVLESCWFDAEKCAVGIAALENYHAKYDEDKKVLTKRPDHDRNSHGADAFRTFAVGYAERVPATEDLSVSEIMRRAAGR